MKKISSVLIVLIACLSFTACGFFIKKETIPEGFKVFNIYLGGMTEEQAKTALKEGVESYVIKATLDSDEFDIAGLNIGYTYNEELNLENMIERIEDEELTAAMIEKDLIKKKADDYTIEGAMLEAYSNGLQLKLIEKESIKTEIEDALKAEKEKTESESKAADTKNAETKNDKTTENTTTTVAETVEATTRTPGVSYTQEEVTKLEKEISEIQTKIDNIYDATRAKIVLDEETKRYVAKDGVEGDTRDYAKAVTALKEAAGKLDEKVSLTADKIHSMGEKAADIPTLLKNVEEANKFFDLTITYNFNAPDSEPASEVLNADNIASYLYVSTNGREVLIDETNLSLYAADICNKHAKITTTDTTNDDNTVTTTRSGVSAEANTVFSNILKSMENKTSDTYEAEYVEVSESSVSENGSKYVYVDLDNQKVTVYVEGEEAVSCSCVSGCVSQGRSTPTGTYSIYYKARNQTLRGPGYASFVNYWMPFNGGIGLHDADGWRSNYGGTIYMYSGSHGCINIPKWAAAKIYDIVDAGTRVVVVGGVQSSFRANDNAVSTTAAATTTAATTEAESTTVAPSTAAPSTVTPSTATPTAPSTAAPSSVAPSTEPTLQQGIG